MQTIDKRFISRLNTNRDDAFTNLVRKNKFLEKFICELISTFPCEKKKSKKFQ